MIIYFLQKHDMSLFGLASKRSPCRFVFHLEAPEAASPGGVSVASRVSLGEAAGLANEAANLGKLGSYSD